VRCVNSTAKEVQSINIIWEEVRSVSNGKAGKSGEIGKSSESGEVGMSEDNCKDSENSGSAMVGGPVVCGTVACGAMACGAMLCGAMVCGAISLQQKMSRA
jgi:hypothetical protein